MAIYGLKRLEAGEYEYGEAAFGSATHYISRDIIDGRWLAYQYRAPADVHAGLERTFRPSDCLGKFDTLRSAFVACYDDARGIRQEPDDPFERAA